jgi:hypothetical protein
MPKGEQLRRAIRWISDERLNDPGANVSKLIGDACLKFNLPPKDADFLVNFFTLKDPEESGG